MKAKLKVWVVFADGVKLGQGRAAFLRLIDELGSIKQAVERFEMSYRNAWGYLRDLERAAGFRLLDRQPGGSRASGTRLSPRGREFLDKYDRFVRQVEERTSRAFQREFPTRTRPGGRSTKGASPTPSSRRSSRSRGPSK